MNTHIKKSKDEAATHYSQSPLWSYGGEDKPRSWIVFVIIALLFGSAAYLLAAEPAAAVPSYHVSELPSLGGTNSGGSDSLIQRE